jgi:hypothetical protein
MPHALVRSQIPNCRIDIAQSKRNRTVRQPSSGFRLSQEPFSICDETRQPGSVLPQIVGGWFVQIETLILRVAKQTNRFEPGHEFVHHAISAGPVILRVQIDHHSHCLPARGFHTCAHKLTLRLQTSLSTSSLRDSGPTCLRRRLLRVASIHLKGAEVQPVAKPTAGPFHHAVRRVRCQHLGPVAQVARGLNRKRASRWSVKLHL